MMDDTTCHADALEQLAHTRRLLEEWATVPRWVRRYNDLTHALLQGAEAGRIQASHFTDNPYSAGSDWRWAWWTGFDLGRRIDGLVRENVNLIAAEIDRLQREQRNGL